MSDEDTDKIDNDIVDFLSNEMFEAAKPKMSWGRSPGMEALPDVLEVNTIWESVTIAIEKDIKPPILSPTRPPWWKIWMCKIFGHKWKITIGVDPARGEKFKGYQVKFCPRCLLNHISKNE